MLSSKKTFFLVLINSLFIMLLLFLSFFYIKKEPVVYIDNAKVFSQFNMSIEMKTAGEKEISFRSKVVDSLFNLIQNTENSQTKEALVKEFALQKKDLENFSAGFANQESDKIWARIKTYVKDFSEENGYELILGMQPNENILYGAPTKDVSNEFIIYINKKYEGNK